MKSRSLGSARGYQYSRFCELYHRWARQLDLVLRQEHRAGEKLFVDHAGQTVPIVDAHTGQSQEAVIFVAVLGASNYTYAEATGRPIASPCARVPSSYSPISSISSSPAAQASLRTRWCSVPSSV